MFKSNDKTERITIRLNENQMDFINEMADRYGFNTSDYIRMLVNHQMYIKTKQKENDNANK